MLSPNLTDSLSNKLQIKLNTLYTDWKGSELVGNPSDLVVNYQVVYKSDSILRISNRNNDSVADWKTNILDK